MDRKRIEAFLAIPKKANKVLQVLSLFLFCILVRLAYLTLCEHKNKEKQEQAITQKVVFEPAFRGTIQDRFGITLARNGVEYQVGVVWSDIIDQIPRFATFAGQGGVPQRIPCRKKYIQALSSMIAKELSLDPKRIEDVIYSYAVFSHNVPVPIQSNLTEEQFYRFNAKVRLWPGLVVERKSRRIYPKGPTSCHIVGYTAPLSREEYDSVISEMRILRAYVKAKEVGEEVSAPFGITSYFHAKERLRMLERCGYGMFDSVGKAGIEASCDEQLRGARGIKRYVTNSKGDILVPSSFSERALSGKRIMLTISSELQEYCESLLLKSEEERRKWWSEKKSAKHESLREPLVRGGAIVVLDPKSHEVLALASTPRFDPNECQDKLTQSVLFKKQKAKPISWIRNTTLAESLWDMTLPLSQETASDEREKGQQFLEWDLFVRLICPKFSYLSLLLREQTTLHELLDMQEDLFVLASFFNLEPKLLIEQIWENKLPADHGEHESRVARLQKMVHQTSCLQEAYLLIDMGRLLLRRENMTSLCKKEIGSMTIHEIRHVTSAFSYLMSLLKEHAYSEFQKGVFREWREVHEHEFLQAKRQEEKAHEKPNQPYLQHLDRECKLQFEVWWHNERIQLLKACAGLVPKEQLSRTFKKCILQSLLSVYRTENICLRRDCFTFLAMLRNVSQKGCEEAFCTCLQPYETLDFPLLGSYRIGGSFVPVRKGKELVASIFALSPPPTLSFAFAQASAPGSIFKLVTAYAALQERALKNESVDPSIFFFNDTVFKQNSKIYVGYDSQGNPVPQVYRGGRIPKSLNVHIGQVDMVGAIAASSNPYFSLLADEKLSSPNDLLDAARAFGFGDKTHICLPYESKGRIPVDLSKDKTSLYTTAIGQHTLLSTPIQVAVMLSALVQDGSVCVPKIIKMSLGKDLRGANSLAKPTKDNQFTLLKKVGMDFPLFLSYSSNDSPYRMCIPKMKTIRKVPLDSRVKDILLEGMDAVVGRMKMDTSVSYSDPEVMKAFHEIAPHTMLGKSSTAESLETIGLITNEPPYMYSHTWFGAVFMDKKSHEPSLIVVVFLRYGKFGKQAAPLAAAVEKEWRRIKELHAELRR